jgi:hypothetical protein
MTGFIGPVIRPSNLFLFNGGATVSSAIVLEVTSLEVSEMPNLDNSICLTSPVYQQMALSRLMTLEWEYLKALKN